MLSLNQRSSQSPKVISPLFTVATLQRIGCGSWIGPVPLLRSPVAAMMNLLEFMPATPWYAYTPSAFATNALVKDM